MTIELPLCGECGAAPASRNELECRFCGAVLPWEIWDEISRERVEVVEAEVTSILGAIAAVERSSQFRRAAGPMRRLRRRRLRRMRERLAANESARGDNELPPEIACGLVGVIIFAGFLKSAPRETIVTVCAVAAAATAYFLWMRAHRKPGSKRRRRRRRRRPASVVPFAVLAVSPPRLLPGMPQGLRRKATLYFLSGNQRIVVLDPGVEVLPGQVGFGTVRGLLLDRFESLYDVPVHPRTVSAPDPDEPAT